MQVLSNLDQKGYDWEINTVVERIKAHKGLYKRVVKYRNPKEPRAWKRKVEHGVDIVTEINTSYINEAQYAECRFSSHDFRICRAWFWKSILTRFENYPKPDNGHKWFIVTNKPRNYDSITDLLNEHGIKVLSLAQYINYLIQKSARFFIGQLINTKLSDYSSDYNPELKAQNNNTSTYNQFTKNVYAYDRLTTNLAVKLLETIKKQAELRKRYPYYTFLPPNLA
jgi:hypothetical protein